jgi:hypothetical protein
VTKGQAVAVDDELETGGKTFVEAIAETPEPEGEWLDDADPWPQLSPLELAVCLADANGGQTPMQGAGAT